MEKEIKVLVLMDVLDFPQCLSEAKKILTTEFIDGIILTNIFFGSKIKLDGEYPNMFHLAGLVKSRNENKTVGVEIYDPKDIAISEFILEKSKKLKLDMLWCREGNSVMDRINPGYRIISNQDFSTPPDLEQVSSFKKSLLPGQKIVITSGLSVENIETYLPYGDIFTVNSSVRTNEQEKLEHCPKKMRAFAEKAKGRSFNPIPVHG
ncbi:MAG: hypothetical protein ACR2IQ_00705 [Minisyncoccia bacterium]